MADEMNPLNGPGESDVHVPEIVFGALVVEGRKLDICKTVNGEEVTIVFSVDGRTSAVGSVSIPLHTGDLEKVNAGIGAAGLTRQEIKQLVSKYGIGKVVKLLRENKLSKADILDGKIEEVKNVDEKEKE